MIAIFVPLATELLQVFLERVAQTHIYSEYLFTRCSALIAQGFSVPAFVHGKWISLDFLNRFTNKDSLISRELPEILFDLGEKFKFPIHSISTPS
jgi:hypothetical protein